MSFRQRITSAITLTALALLAVACATDGGQADRAEALRYPIVATGQTQLYDKDGAVLDRVAPGDALYGQDATYLKGAKMAYQDNGDGTVTDRNTA